CVVLVALDDEVRTIGHAKARAEVLHHAADKKTGAQSAHLQHPRRQTRRRRLAMRARDDERVPAADELFFYDLSLRAIEQLAIQDRFNLRVATRQRSEE